MSDKVFLGTRMAQLDTSPSLALVSKVILAVDSENAYIAGDDTGRTIEVTCPYGTQEMANNILAALSSYTYTPAMAQDAILDPAAEIGDGLTMGGVYTVLAQSTLTFDGLMTSDAGAPGQAEQESEYKYQSPVISDINWQLAETRSLISKTSEEILLQVENELQGLSSSFSVQLQQIQSQVTGLDGQVSTILQKVDNITMSVSNGSTSSSISLSVGGVVVSSQNIQMNGLVTFTGLANGTTTINGACIQTGTISANRLDLTGAITFSDLTSSLQTRITDAQDTADTAQATANDVEDTVSGWTYRGTTYIDGSMIQTGTVVASMLLGGEIRLLTDDEDFAGYIALSGASSASYKVIYGGLGATQVVAENGDLYLEAMSGYVTLDGSDGITAKNDFYPSSDGRYNLGDPNFYWDNVYANTSPATSSDRNRKNSITYDMSKYSTLFDALRPTPYKLNDGTSGRTHLGLIAQDVEEAMMSCGISTLSFAGLIKSYTGDGNYRYAIRYDEIIAMLIYEVQQLKSRVATLEGA